MLQFIHKHRPCCLIKFIKQTIYSFYINQTLKQKVLRTIFWRANKCQPKKINKIINSISAICLIMISLSAFRLRLLRIWMTDNDNHSQMFYWPLQKITTMLSIEWYTFVICDRVIVYLIFCFAHLLNKCCCWTFKITMHLKFDSVNLRSDKLVRALN